MTSFGPNSKRQPNPLASRHDAQGGCQLGLERVLEFLSHDEIFGSGLRGRAARSGSATLQRRSELLHRQGGGHDDVEARKSDEQACRLGGIRSGRRESGSTGAKGFFVGFLGLLFQDAFSTVVLDELVQV